LFIQGEKNGVMHGIMSIFLMQ